MRLVTCVHEGRTLLGSWIEGDSKTVDLRRAAQLGGGSDPTAFTSMMALIEAGEQGWDSARDLTANPPAEALLDSTQCKLLSPLPMPAQVRDFLCFEGHLIGAFRGVAKLAAKLAGASEAELEQLDARKEWAIPDIWYEQPLYYIAGRTEIAGHDDIIQRPSYCSYFDYELEFAAVIGKPGRDISRDDAREHIFGYTIYNDWSARDEQIKAMRGMLGPGKGKDFGQGITLGPCIVTADEIGDPYALNMRATVNGEQWSSGSSGDMHYRFEDCIASASRSQTLFPGEIIGSGTVATGCGLEHSRFLEDGDVVELTVSGIGTLRNRVRG
jgi:2-keto-4-pentenoate hydratase/2-oxohepta-3-ene-1,7-dioic acid hydratase in catechol pathway